MGELSYKAARIKQRYSQDPSNFAYGQTKIWDELSPFEKASSMFQEYSQKAVDFAKAAGPAIKEAVTEAGAAGLDVAERANPVEFGKTIDAGIKNIFTGDKNLPASLRFQQGWTERMARPLRLEKLTGKQLMNPDGSVNWDFARKFVGRAMEVPTYAYAGAVQAGEMVGKGLLTRLATRTVESLPEAGINTALQTGQEGSTENLGTNLLINALLMSGVSNIVGEIRLPSEVLNKSIADIESVTGKLTPEQKVDVTDALKQGVRADEILTNMKRIEEGSVSPQEVADIVNYQVAAAKKTEAQKVDPIETSLSRDGGANGYTSVEKKKLYADIIEPKIKALGELADDEQLIFRDGPAKSGDYVNTEFDRIWDYPVDKDFTVAKVKKSQLGLTGNEVKDEVGYRLLKEEPKQIEETPVIKETETPTVKAKEPETVKVPQEQLPVGTGKEKVSRLEARMTGNLEKMTEEQRDTLGLATYNQMNKAEQKKAAIEYVTKNPDNVVKILSGEMEPPKGLLKNSIYVAADAIAHEDAALARKLASLSSTRAGQELSILTELNPDSPVAAMREVAQARIQATERRLKSGSVSKARNVVTKSIKEKIEKALPKKDDWAAFVESIKCNS